MRLLTTAEKRPVIPRMIQKNIVCSLKYQGFWWSGTGSHSVFDFASYRTEQAYSIIAKFRGSLPIGEHIGVPNTAMYQPSMNLFRLEWLIPLRRNVLKYHLETVAGQKVGWFNPPIASCRQFPSQILASLGKFVWPLCCIFSGTAQSHSRCLASVGPVEFECSRIFLRSIRWDDPCTIRGDLGICAFFRSISGTTCLFGRRFHLRPLEKSNTHVSESCDSDHSLEINFKTFRAITMRPPSSDLVQGATQFHWIWWLQILAVLIAVIAACTFMVGFVALHANTDGRLVILLIGALCFMLAFSFILWTLSDADAGQDNLLNELPILTGRQLFPWRVSLSAVSWRDNADASFRGTRRTGGRRRESAERI
jgi:hypothetical protein